MELMDKIMDSKFYTILLVALAILNVLQGILVGITGVGSSLYNQVIDCFLIATLALNVVYYRNKVKKKEGEGEKE